MSDKLPPLNILMVEDSQRDADLIQLSLRKEGLESTIHVVDDTQALKQQLEETHWDAVLSDCMIPGMSVDEALEIVRRHNQDMPFIALSGEIREEDAVRLLKNGAQDFINKNNLSRLVPALERELREAEVKSARRKAEQALKESEERFKLAMKGSNDGLWDWDLTTGHVYYSPKWCEMVGLDPDAAQPTVEFSKNLVHPNDSERVVQAMNALIKGSSNRLEVEFRAKHAKGFYINVLARGFAISQDNRVERVVGTNVNITNLKKKELELKTSKEQLRSLAGHLLNVREEEKAKIAHEIHDELGATLTALNMDIRWLQNKVSEEQNEIQSKISSMGKLVATAADECSKIVTDLRPTLLDDLGLLAAIEWQATEFQTRYDIQCAVTKNVEHLNLDDKISIAIFRILQEALTNVARHANAKKVEVIILCKDNTLYLQVADDGKGMVGDQSQPSNEWIAHTNKGENPLTRTESFGLKGMRERAVFINGKLNIESEEEHGTRIILSVPLGRT